MAQERRLVAGDQDRERVRIPALERVEELSVGGFVHRAHCSFGGPNGGAGGLLGAGPGIPAGCSGPSRRPSSLPVSKNFDPNAAAAADAGLYGLGTPLPEAAAVVLGVPFDATASYRKGAAGGPRALLRASLQVDLYDLVHGRPYEAGIAMAPIDGRFDAWNAEAGALADRVIAVGGNVDGDPSLARALARVNALGLEVNRAVRAATEELLTRGALPVVVGGDHSTPFGAIEACAHRHPGLGVLHFDAHADLRVAYEGFQWSHASIMDNVTRRIPEVSRLVQVGIRDFCEQEFDAIGNSGGRIRTIFDRDWAAARFDGKPLRELVRAHLAHLPEKVFVSFDIDALEPALCPNTGTPVPGGLTWREANLWLDELAASGRTVVGLDLNEVSPGPAPGEEDAWDAIVGARLLYRMIATALATR
jgi:agmatinase